MERTYKQVQLVLLLLAPFVLFPGITKLWFYIASKSPDLALGYTLGAKIHSSSFWLIYLVPPLFFITVIINGFRSYKTSILKKDRILYLICLTLGITFSLIYLLSLTLIYES